MTTLKKYLIQFANVGLCLGVLSAFFVLGSVLSSVLLFPVSTSIYGLICLLTCLFLLPNFANWMIKTASLLLNHMVLFFIPPVMGVFLFWPLIQTHALALFLAVFVSTLVSFVITGLFAQRCLQTHSQKSET